MVADTALRRRSLLYLAADAISDGVTEAESDPGEEFGEARLIEAVLNCCH